MLEVSCWRLGGQRQHLEAGQRLARRYRDDGVLFREVLSHFLEDWGHKLRLDCQENDVRVLDYLYYTVCQG